MVGIEVEAPPSNDVLLEHVRALASGKGATATWDDIYYCFRLLLGRNPNPEEVPGHMSVAGRDLAEIVSQFLNSGEFSVRRLMTKRQDNAELFDVQGFRIYADPEDQAVGCYMPGGIYEPHMTSLFRRTLKAGQTVVDIGMNIGYFSLLASSIVGPLGRVLGIEPNPRNCRSGEASRRENGFGQMEIHAAAASRSNGIMALYASYTNGLVGTVNSDLVALMRSDIVQGLRLDDLLGLNELHLVKIDVEGFEDEALRGFIQHLERFRPIVASELTPGAMADPRGYLEFLFGLGYQIGVIENDGVRYTEQAADAIIEVQRRSGVGHIDICASMEALA